MEEVIRAFFDEEIGGNRIEVYNEFSLQHELGIYLRTKLENKKVQFERNVSFFKWSKQNFEKKEIDISIIEENGQPDTAIELKFPRNGQVPEQMYSFCKDIAFTEQLRSAGFREAFAIILVEDELFYSGREKDGIYSFFRRKAYLKGKIKGPTKMRGPAGTKKDRQIFISKCHKIDWQTVRGKIKYALVHVD